MERERTRWALRLKDEDVAELVVMLMRQVYMDLMEDREMFATGRERVGGVDGKG